MATRANNAPARRCWLAPTVTLASLIVVWQLVCMAGLVPTYLLPSPVQVVEALVGDLPCL